MKNRSKKNISEIISDAWKRGSVIPGFNIPYLPMMEPVVRALKDTNSFGLIMVARLECHQQKPGGLNNYIFNRFR